ncbi:unnamed protein product [Rhodiola kirilowii]
MQHGAVVLFRIAEVLMDMDLQDERNGRMEEIHQQLPVAYCQFTVTSQDFCRSGHSLLYDVKKSEDDPEINNSENTPSPIVNVPLEDDQQHVNVKADPSNLQVVLHSQYLI